MQISDNESRKSVSSFEESVESGEFLSSGSEWNLRSDNFLLHV